MEEEGEGGKAAAIASPSERSSLLCVREGLLEAGGSLKGTREGWKAAGLRKGF